MFCDFLIKNVLTILIIWITSTMATYPFYLDSYPSFRTFTAPTIPQYSLESPYISNFSPYVPVPYLLRSTVLAPTVPPAPLNFFVETPYTIANRLTKVPLYVISQDKINLVNSGNIKKMPSKSKPIITVQQSNRTVIDCTPAVRIALAEPILVTQEQSEILFPTEMSVLYDQLRLPIQVGAVVAPVAPGTVVSPDQPLSVNVVYALPELPEQSENNEIDLDADVALNKPVGNKKKPRPSKTDYVNHDIDVKVDADRQAVIVEGSTNKLGDSTTTTSSKPIDTDNFTDKPEEFVSEDDDDDTENRNPPQEFHNSKESDVLNELREQSKKQRLK